MADKQFLKGAITGVLCVSLVLGGRLVGTHGQYTPAIGAALFYVKEFIHSV